MSNAKLIAAIFTVAAILTTSQADASNEVLLDRLNSASLQERQAMLEREAKKEGKVVFYTTLHVGDLSHIKGQFERKYPYLKVEPFRLGSTRLVAKIRNEALSGRLDADVLSFPAPYLSGLKDLGILARNRTPFRNQLASEFIDKDGWLNGLYSTAYVLEYNTRRVKTADLPKTWNDLLHPRWRNELALDQNTWEWFFGVLKFMGEEKGKKFAQDLTKQDVAVRDGHTILSQMMQAGEFSIVLDQYDHIAYKAKQVGGPSNYLFLNPIVAEAPATVSIGQKSSRPHAAALFADFLLSKETQQFLTTRGRRLSHKEVPYLLNPPANYRWIYLDSDELGKKTNQTISAYREIFLASR
jgi:iron(III) transport system substrate-binding protein